MAANAAKQAKTVADPCAAYESIAPLWKRSRAACSGERYIKEYDSTLDKLTFKNLLIPFSVTMSQRQYDFYRAEAEWPGITAQYSKILVGGLLRKKPQLTLPDGVPVGATEWIVNEFTKDSGSLSSFLDEALWEELQTSRAWVFVDYPTVANRESMTREEVLALKPFPVIRNAESIINWRIDTDPLSGAHKLSRIIVRGYEQVINENEFHPDFIDTVWVHELDASGFYQIRKFQKGAASATVLVINGRTQTSESSDVFSMVGEPITDIVANDVRLSEIPAWPLNGSIETLEPILSPLIDKEIALYNKMSRRNHLLYGAATYTPVLSSNISDDEFKDIVEAGLGSWIKLGQGDTAGVLQTPTEALADMDKAIASGLEEIAKLGIRMLSPETAQSGVALELRNAAQTAQLGTLNSKVSSQMADIIAFMINWRYDLEIKSSDIKFSLSEDFNPAPLGADWLRLVTEWYENGLLPRSTWLQILKQNDIMPPDYNDEEGQQEINDSDLIVTKQEQTTFNNQLTAAMNGPQNGNQEGNGNQKP
jgi:hypothetical protein